MSQAGVIFLYIALCKNHQFMYLATKKPSESVFSIVFVCQKKNCSDFNNAHSYRRLLTYWLTVDLRLSISFGSLIRKHCRNYCTDFNKIMEVCSVADSSSLDFSTFYLFPHFSPKYWVLGNPRPDLGKILQVHHASTKIS